ncbi:MAG: carboxypeptidase-like regulatory domain-containing protein [Saprospiraceae bacterium]|nr:carboxypeptidase-like regulatory domain-containing protein [Lewinella sp.]
MLKITALLLNVALAFQLQAQISISGTVLNADDLSPVDFAHIILLSQQHLGAITDEDGRFSLSLPERLSQDTLVISRIGYQHYSIPLSSLHKEGDVLVKLKPEAFTLKEATVLADGGLKHLLRRAMARRTENYPSEKHRLKAFFREYSTVDHAFTHLSEAFITFQDDSYSKSTLPRLYLQELRRSRDERHLPPQLARMRNNECIHSFEFNNVMKNSRFKFFPLRSGEAFLDSCRLTYLGATTSEKDTLIRIGYTDLRFKVITTDKNPWYYVRGEIVVNKTDLGIVEYLGKFGRNDDESPWQEIHYQKVAGKYYPSYITINLNITYNQRTTNYTVTKQFHIYKVETGKKQFSSLKGQKRIPEEQSLWNIRYTYHPTFWKDHPVVRQLPIHGTITEVMDHQDLERQFRESARRVEE